MPPEKPAGLAVPRLDPLNACLWRRSERIALTPKAFAILQHLVQHTSRLVTKAELLEAVWPDTHVGDAVLKVCVREIRKTLGDRPDPPLFIKTVHRRGYQFIGRIEVVGAPAGVDRERRIPLVGRDDVLLQLRGRLKQALGGGRQVVFVTGEPGLGKTTVVEAFLERAAGPDVHVARGQCLEHYGEAEPYLPVLEALGGACREPGGERVVAVLAQYAPTWLAQMPSLAAGAERDALRREVLGATRERMLREMAEAMEALTAETPVVFALEDLHWSDYSTLDLLSYLARRRGRARLLIVGTYRPVEVILRDHPLKTVKQDLQLHGFCQELPLEFLTERAVAQYLEARFPSHRLPVDFASLVNRRQPVVHGQRR